MSGDGEKAAFIEQEDRVLADLEGQEAGGAHCGEAGAPAHACHMRRRRTPTTQPGRLLSLPTPLPAHAEDSMSEEEAGESDEGEEGEGGEAGAASADEDDSIHAFEGHTSERCWWLACSGQAGCVLEQDSRSRRCPPWPLVRCHRRCAASH